MPRLRDPISCIFVVAIICIKVLLITAGLTMYMDSQYNGYGDVCAEEAYRSSAAKAALFNPTK